MGMIQNMMGMGGMTEQVIATDFLLAAKTGVRNYAVAVGEAITPAVREILTRHLFSAIDLHEKIALYMREKGYYNAYDPAEQLKIDFKAADTVLGMGQEGYSIDT